MHGMKIQICQQGLYGDGLILRLATLGPPAFLFQVAVASGRQPQELWNMEVNERMVSPQLTPCWLSPLLFSCSLPLPTSLHQPWGTTLILVAFPKHCPHQNPLQITQF